MLPKCFTRLQMVQPVQGAIVDKHSACLPYQPMPHHFHWRGELQSLADTDSLCSNLEGRRPSILARDISASNSFLTARQALKLKIHLHSWGPDRVTHHLYVQKLEDLTRHQLFIVAVPLKWQHIVHWSVAALLLWLNVPQKLHLQCNY